MQGRRHEPNSPLQGCRASTDKCPGLVGTGFGIEAATEITRFVRAKLTTVGVGAIVSAQLLMRRS